MKQSKEIEGYRKMVQEFEDRGAARERERYFATIGTIAGELKKLTDRMTALMLKMEAKSEAVGPRPQPKKRKAVEANAIDIHNIQEVFTAAANGTILQPKNIKGTGIGSRTIAAACRSLVESHVLEKVGAKGYRLVQRKENGLDEAMSARTPAE